MQLCSGYKILIVVCSVILTIVVCHIFAVNIGIPADWTTYRLAARALIEGRSPYDLDHDCQFYNPPWALLPLIPFAYLPPPLDSVGILMLGLIGVVGFCYLVRMPAKNALVWLLTPPVIGCIIVGQIDWMVLYGFTTFCPPILAFFLLLIKPQVGLGMAVYLFVRLWQRRNLSYAINRALPVALCLCLSFAVYGFWPVNAFSMAEQEVHWFTTVWPQAIPVGIALLYLAVRKRDCRYAMGAAPCLSNHVTPSSWMGALVALSDKPKLLLIISISMWAVMILHGLGVF